MNWFSRAPEQTQGLSPLQTTFMLVLAPLLLLISACSSPQKRIIFKSRVPSIEAPLFNENLQFGISTQLESQRFEVQLSGNLVDDFSFRRNGERFSGDGDSLKLEGLDLALTGALGEDLYAFQAEVSADFFELKAGAGSLYPRSPTKWILMAGGGIYRTAIRVSSGKCDFFCLSSEEDSKKTQSIENRIETQQSGQEIKLSGTLGYRLSDKWIIYLGYSQMNYRYHASATDPTRNPSKIELNETFEGVGYGGGIAFQAHRHFQMSIAAQNISLNWDNRRHERGMGTVNFNLAF